jgi:hypothetical protein
MTFPVNIGVRPGPPTPARSGANRAAVSSPSRLSPNLPTPIKARSSVGPGPGGVPPAKRNLLGPPGFPGGDSASPPAKAAGPNGPGAAPAKPAGGPASPPPRTP